MGDSPSLLHVPRRRRPLLAAAPVLQVTSSPVCVDMSGMSVPTEFLSRHSSDAVITFVDPRCISVIGYQPQVGLPELTAVGGFSFRGNVLMSFVGDAGQRRCRGHSREGHVPAWTGGGPSHAGKAGGGKRVARPDPPFLCPAPLFIRLVFHKRQ